VTTGLLSRMEVGASLLDFVGGEGREKSPRRRFLFFPQGAMAVGAWGSLSSSVLEGGGSQEVISLRLELYRL
jgi:hypothetical protein